MTRVASLGYVCNKQISTGTIFKYNVMFIAERSYSSKHTQAGKSSNQPALSARSCRASMSEMAGEAEGGSCAAGHAFSKPDCVVGLETSLELRCIVRTAQTICPLSIHQLYFAAYCT